MPSVLRSAMVLLIALHGWLDLCFAQPPAALRFGAQPVRFEANIGQVDPNTLFIARGLGHPLWVTKTGFQVASANRPGTPLAVRLAGTSQRMTNEGLDAVRATTNYLMGSDPSRWRTDIPNFERVRMKGVYPGIDLVYYGQGETLECDFVLQPGADPAQIDIDIQGASAAAIDPAGDLVVKAPGGGFRWHKPTAFQEVSGVRRLVDATYILKRSGRLAIQLGRYDRKEKLVIDPVLVYSTYVGGAGVDDGTAIAVDANGAVYIAGTTSSTDFPISAGVQSTLRGPTDAYVMKLDSGGALVYATYFGGSKSDGAAALALDSAGNAYVAGATSSTDFPLAQPFSTVPGAGFVAKLNASGTALVYSSYLAAAVIGIAVDASQSAYVVGGSGPGFPLVNPAQPVHGGDTDAFVAKLNASGTALVYSTYLGGAKADVAVSVAVDGGGSAYIVGYTDSSNFPLKNAGWTWAGISGAREAFAAKLSANGSALVYATYLGIVRTDPVSTPIIHITGIDQGYANGVAVDGTGSAFIAGGARSFSTLYTPLGINSSFTSFGWLLKLSADGRSKAYTVNFVENPLLDVALDAAGNAHVVGTCKGDPRQQGSASPVNPLQPEAGGGTDACIAKIGPSGEMLFSTAFGGSKDDLGMDVAVDRAGNTYVAGSTKSADFPTKGSFQPLLGGTQDGWIAKIGYAGGTGTCALDCWAWAPERVVASATVQFSGSATVSNCTGKVAMDWDFGNGKPHSAARAPTHQYESSGLYAWTAVASVAGAGSCRQSGRITVLEGPLVAWGGVVNAASYDESYVAPGEMVTVFGTLIGPATMESARMTPDGAHLANTLGGFRYLLDGVPAPIIYASSGQSAVVVPYSVGGQSSTKLQVESGGIRSESRTLFVHDSHPGIFTADSSGSGLGAIINQDGSRNSPSNPAPRGSIITLYATGAGETDPPGEDGKITHGTYPKPKLPVSATIQGLAAAIDWVGSAPEMVSGLLQVNVRIPDGVRKPMAALNGGARAKPVSLAASSVFRFAPNRGQFPRGVEFAASLPGHEVLLARAAAVTHFRSGEKAGGRKYATVRMALERAEEGEGMEGLDVMPAVSNYLVGRDRSKWRTNVPNFQRVRAKSVYPNVDLIYYGTAGKLEYDFVVHRGGDPARIGVSFTGARSVRKDGEGNLVLATAAGPVRWQKPVAYQDVDGTRRLVRAEYLLEGRRVGFRLGWYDRTRDLTIDPVLVYASYFGGSGDERLAGMAVDADGNVVLAGSTESADFPVRGSLKAGRPELYKGDLFISKFDATGSKLIFSTYLGGSGNDGAVGLALDRTGNIYLTGSTGSQDFPLVKPLNVPPSPYGFCSYVLKLDKSGASLLYSSFLTCGPGFSPAAMAVDSSGGMYIAGSTSTQMPTVNAVQSKLGGDGDAFAMKLAPDGSAVVFSTYLGGGDSDEATAVALDASGAVYVAGYTTSNDFPLSHPFQSALKGSYGSVFVSKLASDGSALVYSTYLGDSYERPGGMAVDPTGALYVTGRTGSADFPMVNATGRECRSALQVFLTKLDPSGSALLSSSCLTQSWGYAKGVTLDRSGNVYVTGLSDSSNDAWRLTTADALQRQCDGDDDCVYLAVFDPGLTRLVYGTMLGAYFQETESRGVSGVSPAAVDAVGNIWLAGTTFEIVWTNGNNQVVSRDLTKIPVTANAFQPSAASIEDLWLAKFSTAIVAELQLTVGKYQSKPVTVVVASQ